MAFAAPDPNQPVPGQPSPQMGQAPVAAGGAGVAGSSAAPATPGQNVPQQPSAQLSAYLAANQPQSTQFASNIAGDLAGQNANLSAGINPAVNAYTSNLYSVPTDANVNAAVAANPSSLTPDQQATFKNELGAAAKAPNSASTFETTQPYQDLTSNIQKAVEQANLWSSGNNMPAISAALAPYEQAGQTSGNTTLDALLLAQTPGAYKQINDAITPTKALPGQLAAGASSANDALKAAIAADTAATPAAKGAAGQYVTGLNSNLSGYLKDAQKNADAYNTAVSSIGTQESAILQPQIAALENAIAAYNAMLTGNGQQPGALFSPPPGYSDLSPITYGQLAPLPATAAAPPVSKLGSVQDYLNVGSLENLMGPSDFAALNPSITSATADQAGTYQLPPSTAPALNQLVFPITAPVSGGIAKNTMTLDNNQLLSTTPQVVDPFNAVINALNALQGSVSSTVTPAPTYTMPGTPASAPTQTPPTSGGGTTAPPAQPATPPPTGLPPKPGFGIYTGPDGSQSYYLLPPTHGIGLT